MRAPPPLPAKKTTEIVPALKFKTKIEPWMIGVVEAALTKGLPLPVTAGLIGVSKRTLARWRELGSDEACTDPLLTAFAVTVERARSEAIQAGVEMLGAHAAADWRATLELLKAQDPETWSPASKSKVEVEVSAAQPRNLSLLSDEEFAMLEMLENKILAAKALPSG